MLGTDSNCESLCAWLHRQQPYALLSAPGIVRSGKWRIVARVAAMERTIERIINVGGVRLIPDAPVCAPSNVPLIGASLEESVTILCRVTADPPNIQFEWTFSSSGERFEVPAGQYTTVQDGNPNTGNNGYGSSANDKSSTYMGQGISSHTEINGKYPSRPILPLLLLIALGGCVYSFDTLLVGRSNAVETVSELLYVPKNERDFGTLACWAKNSIGKQTEPCLFQVVPAGEHLVWSVIQRRFPGFRHTF